MDKKFLFILFFSTATLLGVHYFTSFYQSTNEAPTRAVPTNVVPGQAYRVPAPQDLTRPINSEIDFWDKKVDKSEEIKTVETDLCSIAFSNYGGVISTIDFKKHLGKNKTPLRTIYYKDINQKEQGAFLVALDEKTPYLYEFVGIEKFDDKFEISYKTETDDLFIKKTYQVYKKNYKINLNVDFENKSKDKQNCRARIFMTSPFVEELAEDKANGFSVGLDGKSVSKIGEKGLDQAWISPSLFGTEDKYFAHALVSDQNYFTQRAFFKVVGSSIFSILEGPEIKDKSSWLLSFYVGPKLVKDMEVVDPRLGDLLDYGWLSWLCKLLLALLEYVYSFLNNFGLAIIVLTFILKLPFVPLTIAGRRKIDRFQKYQPTINKIRTKYRNDLQMQQVELMKFYKDHDISPAAPVLGCLPMVVQMPILFALYRVLNGYLDLYNAPFFGWITDLSAKDPYYVLPILMGASTILQQLNMPNVDARQRVAMFFLPVFLTAVFLNFPAGLVLYWLMNNVFSIGEDYLRKAFFK